MNEPKKQKIFVPFTIDTRYWDTKLPNVFLNKVYEAQVEDNTPNLDYTTLTTIYTYRNDAKFQQFCVKLVGVLGNLLNQYHGLHESPVFWGKWLYEWILDFASGVRFKIEQFHTLLQAYPKEKYAYCSYGKRRWKDFLPLGARDLRGVVISDEEFHFFSYVWLAANYFGFQVDEKNIEYAATAEKKESFSFNFYDLVHELSACVKKIRRALMNACPSKLRVGTYDAQYGRFSSVKWFLWSRGAIQEVALSVPEAASKVDMAFRDAMPARILECMAADEEERMILELLPQVFPQFFLENFKPAYDAANLFLAAHPNLVLMYTLIGMVGSSPEKICMLLLQKRGGKVIGQQHGGTYQVTTSEQEHVRELALNDMFYYWGKGACSYSDSVKEFPNCKISYGPTHKFDKGGVRKFFSELSPGKQRSGQSILFTGTALEAYPRAYTCGNVDGEKWEYIQRKFQFLSALSEIARGNMIVREFPKDYGWHMKEKIRNRFPNLKFSSDEEFNNLLDGCSLFIADVLSTPWIEAVYIEKPVVFLLFDYAISIQNYKFRKEEKRYIKMLEKVGIIVHSPEEAAKLVNHLADSGITEWWMDEERQRVVRLVRERWTMKVDDSDRWWYRELMEQARRVEQSC